MNGFTRALLALIAVGMLVVAGAGFVGLQFLKTPPSSSSEEIVFEVKPGQSFKTVTRHLEEMHLVTSAFKLQMLGRFSTDGTKIRVGEYALRKNMLPRELLGILSSGHSIEYPVTVSEGLNRFEIADIVGKTGFLDKQEFLKTVSDPTVVKSLTGGDYATLEGYLYPETYNITKFTGVKALVKMMVDRYKDTAAKLKAMPGWNAAGLSDREILVLASIVEKETGAPEERPLISSVFHNRLNLKMPLQTDPTIIYGLWNASGVWNRNISRADLTTPGLYNTYLNQGLPPGPISNPGAEAIKAAGFPAKSEFLFFVSKNDGTHIFSETYAKHLKAVAKFQLDKKAREGHSWRELKNRAAPPAPLK